MKTCSRCKVGRPADSFYPSKVRKDGLSSWCKGCEVEKARKRRKTPDRFRGDGCKECPGCSKVKPFSEYFTTAHLKDGLYCYCKTCQREAGKKSYLANREKVQQRVARRKSEDPAFAMACRILGLVRKGIDRRALGLPVKSVSGSFWAAVGYTSADLARHLERQFVEGMTWEGRRLWHIDHITPLKAFSYESFDSDEFRACWALSNLRPIWKTANLKKGGKQEFLL